MRELAKLIGRVAAATGPDREIDKAVFVALVDPKGEKGYWNWQGSRPQGSPPKSEASYWDSRHTPAITASIDAALALTERVLPAVVIDLTTPNRWAEEKNFMANITPQEQPFPVELDIFAEAPTLPLAIILATLRALQARQP